MKREVALSVHGASGLFALALCGGPPSLIAAVALPLVASAPWVRPPISGGWLLALLVVICAPIMMWAGPDDAVLIALIGLLVHQRTAPEIDRKDDWVALLTALMLVASTVRVDHPAYALAWLGWTVTLPFVLGAEDARATWRSAAATSALVVAIAVLAFVLLPRPSDERPFPGIGEQVEVGHFIDADHRHEQVATARSPDYEGTLWLRATSFTAFDGRTWQRRPEDTAPAGADITAPGATFTLHQEAQGGIVLLPGPLTDDPRGPEAAREPDGTRWTRATGGLSLNTHAAPDAPWPAFNPPDAALLEVPDELEPTLAGILRNLGADAPAADSLQRITTWVHDAHAYEAGGVDSPDLLTFLSGAKRGDCSHFATSTVLLARQAGMPARLVTGYVRDAERGDTWAFRRGDAHAWAEVYLADVGWSRVDATAAQRVPAPNRAELTAAQQPIAPRSGPPRPPLWEQAWTAIRDFDAVSRSTVLRLLAPLVGVAALVALGLALRNRRPTPRATPPPRREGIAAELDRALAALERHGLRPSPSTPAVETARALGKGEVGAALEELAWLHYEVVFGGADEAGRLDRARELAGRIVATARRG